MNDNLKKLQDYAGIDLTAKTGVSIGEIIFDDADSSLTHIVPAVSVRHGMTAAMASAVQQQQREMRANIKGGSITMGSHPKALSPGLTVLEPNYSQREQQKRAAKSRYGSIFGSIFGSMGLG